MRRLEQREGMRLHSTSDDAGAEMTQEDQQVSLHAKQTAKLLTLAVLHIFWDRPRQLASQLAARAAACCGSPESLKSRSSRMQRSGARE